MLLTKRAILYNRGFLENHPNRYFYDPLFKTGKTWVNPQKPELRELTEKAEFVHISYTSDTGVCVELIALIAIDWEKISHRSMYENSAQVCFYAFYLGTKTLSWRENSTEGRTMMRPGTVCY